MIEPLVMVVDDSSVNLELYADLLEMGGCRPLCISEPDKISAEIRDGNPALLLLDVNLGGHCGIRLGARLKAEFGDETPPIIAVTALRRDGLDSELRQAGFLALLPKPCSIDGFLDAVSWGLKTTRNEPFRVFSEN